MTLTGGEYDQDGQIFYPGWVFAIKLDWFRILNVGVLATEKNTFDLDFCRKRIS